MKKTFKGIMTLLTAVIFIGALAFALTTCDDGSGNKDPITDMAALETAIDNAEAAKTGVVISVDGSDVSPANKWVTQAEIGALNIAIATAEAVLANSTTQTQIDNATVALNSAIEIFNAAKKDGTKTMDTNALQTLISAANTLKATAVVSTNGSDVATTGFWVTQEEMNALEIAITAAEEAIEESDLIAAHTALETAMADFTVAKKAGTKQEGGLENDIDPSLYGTWKDELNGTTLTITFSETGITWGGTAGNTLNSTTQMYQGTGYSFVWVAGNGTISYKYSYLGGNTSTIPVYTYTVNQQGKLELAVAAMPGTVFVTLSKEGGVTAPDAKAITAFTFDGINATVVINDTATPKTISVTVPYNTDITSLIPTVTHTGASYSPTGAQNFTNPVTYTVTAADNSTTQYIVTVTVGTPTLNYTALNTAISSANTAKTGAVINTAAANVDVGTKWVTQEEMDALNTAIAAAQTAKTNATTQAQIDNAVSTLNTAVTVFNSVKKDGSKTNGGGENWVIINSAEDLSAYLETATGGDSADEQLLIKLNVNDLGSGSGTPGSIGYIIRNSSKYISLDLSGSTFTGIREDAFHYCHNLISVTIGDSVENMEYGAFWHCHGLTGVTIGKNITGIAGAFSECYSLASVIIPDNVTNIGPYAFNNTALTSVTFEGTITSANFSDENSFPGDLRAKYLENGIGTYIRESSSSTWTYIGSSDPFTYTVTYNANGGSGNMAQSTHTVGESKALTINTFTRDNYTFAGWSTTSGVQTVVYTDGQEVLNLRDTAGNVDLYAQWTINTYTVTFDSISGSAVDSQDIEHGGTVTRPSDPTRAGYVLIGWYSNSTFYGIYNVTVNSTASTARSLSDFKLK